MVNEISAAEFDGMLADLDCRVMERGESAEAAAEAVTGGNRELDALLVSAYRGDVRSARPTGDRERGKS